MQILEITRRNTGGIARAQAKRGNPPFTRPLHGNFRGYSVLRVRYKVLILEYLLCQLLLIIKSLFFPQPFATHIYIAFPAVKPVLCI
jgi:hypothetical protein